MRFDIASVHIEHAKSYATDNAYLLGLAMELPVAISYRMGRIEEATSELLHIADVYEKLGAMRVKECRELVQCIQEKLNSPFVSGQSGSDCELFQ
jgi:hypothetical protein